MDNPNFNKILADALAKQNKATNADHIRAMTDEGLAKLIAADWCELMPCECDHFCDGNCEKWILKWLKEEVEDD